MKAKFSLIIGIIACIAAFFAGRRSVASDIAFYSVDQQRVAVVLKQPTYGLPLVEYSLVLSEFRAGDPRVALFRLEMFLDNTIYDAQQRRSAVGDEQLAQLDKALARAADYRRKFPRPLNHGGDVYWTADKQKEVDVFLQAFASR